MLFSGMYECLAYNLELNSHLTRRISLQAETKLSKEQTNLDISDYISIDVVPDRESFRKNANITLQCNCGW